MRSGVIAQKIGHDAASITDDGEHVPVTVLKLENCQVVGHRTADKNGYTAAAARRRARAKVKNTTRKAQRGHFAIAKVEPKRKVAEFRVAAENLIAGRRRDHRRPFRPRPVRRRDRHHDRQGLRRASMKRWNFGGLRASHGVSITPPCARLDRPAAGPGQDLHGQEDGRPHGRRARDHAESQGGRAPMSSAA